VGHLVLRELLLRVDRFGVRRAAPFQESTMRSNVISGALPLVAIVCAAAPALARDTAEVQYARFLKGLTATEVVRSRMASTPNARIIAVLAALSEVAARNPNATPEQLSTFVSAYSTQLRNAAPNDPDLIGGFAVQPVVRFQVRVTNVQGLDTDCAARVAQVLGLDSEQPSRQLSAIAFQYGTVPALATGDEVAVLLKDIFGGRDLSGAANPLVEAHAAAFLRSEGIEPYPDSATLSGQYPEIASALALMPPTAAAFDAERAINFAGLQASIFDEFDAVADFVNAKRAALQAAAAQYPTLASTEAAASNPSLITSAQNARITDLVALNRSRARLSFATAALDQGTFGNRTQGNTLRTYANIQIRVADHSSSAMNTGLVAGGSLLSGVGQALASPNKIGGFMQFAGAVGFGAGLLGNSVRNRDVRPSPFQQLSNQITVMQNQIEDLRFTMVNRFDRVDAGLQALYNSINSGFDAMTGYFIDTTINLQNIQTQLAITQSNLNRFEQNLYGILADGFNFPFVADMETALGYRDRTGVDLNYDQFNSYEGGFYSSVVNDSASSVYAGSDTPLPYDVTGADQLANYPLGYEINQLRTFPTTIGQAALGTLRTANPTTWALNADVYAQFARENPWYGAKILSTTPTRVGDVLNAGQNAQTVMNAAKRQALFDRLLSDHAARSTTLQANIDALKSTQLANAGTPTLNLWGGPTQALATPPAIPGRVGRYNNTNDFVALPLNGSSNAWQLAALEFRNAAVMNIAQRGAGFYTWSWRPVSPTTGGWTQSGGVRVVYNDGTMGTINWYTATYQVDLYWNPNLVGGVNVSGVGTVYVPTDSNVSQMKLVASRKIVLNTLGEQSYPESTAAFRDYWIGRHRDALGSYYPHDAVRDFFFNAQSGQSIGVLNFKGDEISRPYWTASTVSVGAQTTDVRNTINTSLCDRQRAFLQPVVAALGSGADVNNIRLSVSNLDVTTRLTDAYVSLALPETFGFSDLLRGPLRGIGDGIDRANVQRLYADALAAIPTTPGAAAPTVEPRIDTEITNRRGIFQRELNRALSMTRPAESYPFMKWSLASLAGLRDQGLRLAADDTYVTLPNATLVVPASTGLLANDAKQPGATVRAVLLSPPGSGTVVLDPDGAFRYTPASGFSGSISFTYLARATIAATTGTTTVDSLTATVLIRVESCSPSITEQPVGTPLEAGRAATFAVAVNATSRARYQWAKDGISLADSDRILGSTTPVLTVLNTSDSDLGRYGVAVTTDCGTTLSAEATLGVSCPADLNNDKVVDDSDFLVFVAAYDALVVPPANPACDFNTDSLVEDDDFLVFVVAYNALICG